MADSSQTGNGGKNGLGTTAAPRLKDDASNFTLYRQRMEKHLCGQKGFRKHLMGRAKVPVELTADEKKDEKKVDAYEDEMDEYVEKESAIQAIILASISETLQVRLVNSDSAYEMWQLLCAQYQNQNVVILANLKRQLYQIICPEGGDALATIDELLRLGGDYSSAGGELSDTDAAAILINAMPKEYHATIQTAVTNAARDPDKKGLSFTNLISDLTTSVKITQQREKREQDEAKAMAAKYKDWSARSGTNNREQSTTHSQSATKHGSGKARCYNCGGVGHFKAECSSPPDTGAGGGDNGESSRSSDRRGGSGGRHGGRAKKAEEASPEEFAFTAVTPGLVMKASSGGDVVRLLDSGASAHFDPDRTNFVTLHSCDPYPIEIASGEIIHATEMGDIRFACNSAGNEKILTLSDCYYTPQLPSPLISIGQLRNKGLVFSNATKGFGELHTEDGKVILKVARKHNVYPITTWKPRGLGNAKSAVRALSLMEAHSVLGHVSVEAVKKAARDGVFTGLNIDLNSCIETCETCVRAKLKTKAIPKSHPEPRSGKQGELFHSDLWGPSPVTAKGGYRWMSTWTDDYTRMTYLYIQKTKDETFSKYKAVEAWMWTQHGVRIGSLHSDRGGDYIGEEFELYLEKNGTRRSLTVHDSQAMNGVSERKNYTIIDLVRAMLLDSGLPKSLWAHAAMYAVWLRNRMPTIALIKHGKTPYEMANGSKPDMTRARTWGCRVIVNRDGGATKLDPRAIEGRWIGPSQDTADGSKIYWPSSQRITVERSIHFIDDSATVGESSQAEEVTASESVASQQKEATDESQTIPSTTPVSSNPTNDQSTLATTLPPPEAAPTPIGTAAQRPVRFTQTDVNPLEELEATEGEDNDVEGPVGQATTNINRRSSRARNPSSYVKALQSGSGSISARPSDRNTLPRGVSYANVAAGVAKSATQPAIIPRSVNEARNCADSANWEAAMITEHDKLIKMKTYELVPRKEATSTVIPIKWVYDLKFAIDTGEINKFKARLVARGDRQERFINYDETFSPVLKSTSKNVLLALAARHGWFVRTGDFENAYLNGVLLSDSDLENNSDGSANEPIKIYMEQPPGFKEPGKEDHVCLLRKALYGLKQAGRVWYQQIHDYLISIGFTRCESDHAVFTRHTNTSWLILGLHVDDPVVIGSDNNEADQLEATIAASYGYRASGALENGREYIGTSYTRDWEAGTISANQSKFIDALISQTRQENASPLSSPLNPSIKLGKEYCPTEETELTHMRSIPYRETIGLLMYVANGTRPDIAYSVNLLAQVASNPGRVHWEAAKRIVRYLKGTRNWTLTWGKDCSGLVCYSDASHGTEDLAWKSVSGYVFLVYGGAVCWCAKKQPIVAQSSFEAEYVAVTHASKELIWIRTFISEILGPFSKATTIRVDNQAAIAMAKNDSFHPRSKHIALRYHFIRHHVAAGTIALKWVDTQSNLADLFTKVLDANRTRTLATCIGLSA